jgi:foldase protein PrsA
MEGSRLWWRWIAAPLLAAVVALAPSSLADARQSPVLVTINDPTGARTVTKAQLDHWFEVARRSSGAPDSTTPERMLQAQALQLLISFAWIEGEARAQGVTVTDEEAEASFDEQKRQSFPKKSDFRRFLRTSGQSRQDILDRVRLDLLSSKMRDRVVAPATASVTEESIDAFIEENGPIEQPETRDLRVVLASTRALAQQARGALERGASWKQVARRYSIDDTSKFDGGRLRGQAKDTLDPRLDRAVFRARKGRLVGPVKTEYGYYVFTVTRVTPASVMSAKEHRKLVRDHLTMEAEGEALDTFVKSFTNTWKARTVCARAYDWVSDCSNWDGTEVTP